MSFHQLLSRPLGNLKQKRKFFEIILSKRHRTVRRLKEEDGNETGYKQSSSKVTTIYDANENKRTNEA